MKTILSLPSTFLCLLISLTFLLSGCSPDFAGMAEKRLKFARVNQGPIQIVAIQDLQKSNYIKGILLASSIINQRPEKLIGRSLKVNIEQEGDDFESVKSTLRRIAANPKVTAVLGHRRSSIAVPASVIYDRSQIVFMPSFSTAKSLTGHGFQYVFRMVPNSDVMAEQLASVSKSLGHKKIITLYARDDLSRELAFLFEDAAIKQGVKITKSVSFFEKETNYRSTISEFSSDDFDAIFIASGSKAGGLMVKQLREMGVNKPILGNDSFQSATFTNIAGKAADNVITPFIFDAQKNNSPSSRNFIDSYREKYKEEPDSAAAQGYDSVMLLTNAIEKAGSTIPSLLASTLHYSAAWVGTTGIYAFTPEGEIKGKKYFFKTWENNHWELLPAIHIPYLLSRFKKSIDKKNHTIEKPTSDLTQMLTQNSNDDDHKLNLLNLSQKILEFKNIGIIYEDTEEGRKAVNYKILKAFSDQENIIIFDCKVAFSTMTAQKIKQAMTACYGKLSLSIDALFLPTYHGIDTTLLQQLSSSLAFFKIPAISLDEHTTDPSVSLILSKQSGVNLQNMDAMNMYSGLLTGMKVREFSEYLKGLPEIKVNLKNLQRIGLPDTAILKLSPDYFLQTTNMPNNKVLEK